MLLALAAESFNFVYLLVQEACGKGKALRTCFGNTLTQAITLEAVLRQYEPYLLQMLRQAHCRPHSCIVVYPNRLSGWAVMCRLEVSGEDFTSDVRGE